MLRKLHLSAATFTALGLIGGLYYREFTKAHSWTGGGQLGLVHTHFLVLGTVGFLLLMVLERVFALSEHNLATPFFWVYTAGLSLTGAMMAVKGTLQVMESSAANSPAIAGISGTGHMTLTVAFVLLFVILKSRIAEPSTPIADRA